VDSIRPGAVSRTSCWFSLQVLPVLCIYHSQYQRLQTGGLLCRQYACPPESWCRVRLTVVDRRRMQSITLIPDMRALDTRKKVYIYSKCTCRKVNPPCGIVWSVGSCHFPLLAPDSHPARGGIPRPSSRAILFFWRPYHSSPFFVGCSLRRKHDALVLLTPNHVQRLHKVLPAGLDRRRILLVAGQIGVDELDEAVEVLGCDLFPVRLASST
jgi:hypothetical protein